MSKQTVVNGAQYSALANDVSDLVIKHTTLGPLNLDEALSVIVAVVADYARDTFTDPSEALCAIVRDRMQRPMPERLPIQPGGRA